MERHSRVPLRQPCRAFSTCNHRVSTNEKCKDLWFRSHSLTFFALWRNIYGIWNSEERGKKIFPFLPSWQNSVDGVETGSIINLAILTIFIEFVGPPPPFYICRMLARLLLGLYGHIYLMPRLSLYERCGNRKKKKRTGSWTWLYRSMSQLWNNKDQEWIAVTSMRGI